MLTDTLTSLIDEVCQVLLIPCLFALCVLALLAVLSCGAVLCEFFVDRRYRKVDGTRLIFELHQVGKEGMLPAIDGSRLLSRHRRCIRTLLEAQTLAMGEREALAGKLLAEEEGSRRWTLALTDMVIRLGPMAGLLGTLIPLGPGLLALGRGDTAVLSQSLGIAFDTTIIGVLSAGLAYLVSMVRRHWYRSDSVLLESLVVCCLEEMNI